MTSDTRQEPMLLTHGCSLSNLPLFVAERARIFATMGLDVEVRPFTAMSATTDTLAHGAALLGTAAFTQPLIDAARPDPPVLVAGSGLMGIGLLAQPGIREVGALAGRAVATFRGDPLEILLHDALAAVGLAMTDVEVRHLDEIEDAITLFEAGAVAAVTLAEPHASRLRERGAHELSDGTELWGFPFPDTVLVAARSLLDDRPELVAAAIGAMRRAEARIAADPLAAVEHAVHHFPGFSREELARAARRQPPCVDVRPLVSTVLDRWPSLQSLGLVPGDAAPPAGAISLDLLADGLDGSPASTTEVLHR